MLLFLFSKVQLFSIWRYPAKDSPPGKCAIQATKLCEISRGIEMSFLFKDYYSSHSGLLLAQLMEQVEFTYELKYRAFDLCNNMQLK